MLFAGLIDYAGLFPPASLKLDAAIAEYRSARRGPYRWLLGRFIITATTLEELGGRLMTTMTAGEEPWAVSVILNGDVAASAVAARAFDAEMEPAAQVALLEVPLPVEVSDGRGTDAAYDAAAPAVTAALTASAAATPFFEVKLGAGGAAGIAAAAGAVSQHAATTHRPMGAKLRCGGVEAAAFPSAEQVVQFISACTERGLPFKATAGLHHPIRHRDDDLGVMRHGFVNLLVTTALARQGVAPGELQDVVEETDPAEFRLAAAGITWRSHTVRVGDLARTRGQFAAYGSCSFAEPVEDLIGLGMLRDEGPALD